MEPTHGGGGHVNGPADAFTVTSVKQITARRKAMNPDNDDDWDYSDRDQSDKSDDEYDPNAMKTSMHGSLRTVNEAKRAPPASVRMNAEQYAQIQARLGQSLTSDRGGSKQPASTPSTLSRSTDSTPTKLSKNQKRRRNKKEKKARGAASTDSTTGTTTSTSTTDPQPTSPLDSPPKGTDASISPPPPPLQSSGSDLPTDPTPRISTGQTLSAEQARKLMGRVSQHHVLAEPPPLPTSPIVAPSTPQNQTDPIPSERENRWHRKGLRGSLFVEPPSTDASPLPNVHSEEPANVPTPTPDPAPEPTPDTGKKVDGLSRDRQIAVVAFGTLASLAALYLLYQSYQVWKGSRIAIELPAPIPVTPAPSAPPSAPRIRGRR